MLHLLFGRNASGKTEYVRNLVTDKINDGGNGFIMLVPEQFSYETEKAMLSKVGASGMNKVEVLSFTRLAENIIEEYSLTDKKQPVDDGVRAVSMSLAIEGLGETAQIYRKYVSKPALISELIAFANEISQCGVTTDELSVAAAGMKDSTLKSKLSELSRIVSLYNSIISQEYYDDNTALDILYEILEEKNYFSGRTVIVDGFTRFTKQEQKVISRIISQCDDTFFTFCYDSREAQNDEFSLFANVSVQIEKIKRLASLAGVEIKKPVELFADENVRKPDLSFLERNLYRNDFEVFDGDTADSVVVCSAPDISQECEFVAATIKRLMRENGYRCRDMIVFERKKDTYDEQLRAAFRKYAVPYFEDRRQPLNTQPLVVFIKTLFDIAKFGLSTETLIRHLKTGLSALNDDEISELENYALVWRIKPTEWSQDFTQNPRGLGFELSDNDKAELERLNTSRRKAVAPVLSFRKKLREAVKQEKTQTVYNYLVENNVSQRLKKLATGLSGDGLSALYEEQDNVWSLLMNILDRLYLSTKNADVSVERFCELFEILLSANDLGSVPQGLDDVTIAAADRSRTAMKKVVFIVGANDGVFPLNPSTKGLLNDSERIKLRALGIELAETAVYKQTEEKFTAYRAATLASDRLYISYSAANYSGTSLSASSLVCSVRDILPASQCISVENLSPLEKIESEASAFEELARSYRDGNELTSALKEHFENDTAFNGRVKALENILTKKEKQIEDKALAKELFGKNMFVSASKTEIYYKCPFEYFCKYGIKAQPRKQAQLDAAVSGTVIHYIFENVLSEYSKPQLLQLSDDELRKCIQKITDDYLESKMGGSQEKSKRFISHYSGAKEQAFVILKRMIEEFRVSDFTPVDFELSINRDGEIMPYKLELPDGCSLEITGSVDRVDTMQKDGVNYLRIVDYKSGGKTLNLYDIVEGLSTQMLIYLFAIDANGKQKYGEIVPSGILYMSAKTEPADLGRNATEDEINRKKLLSNRMSGLVLNDMDVILGMENDGEGVFIPVTIDKDGSAKGKLVSRKDFENIRNKIDEILKEMVSSLQNGIIPVLPAGESACEWCDYRCVCGFESGDMIREIQKLDDEAVLNNLAEEVSDDE